MRKFVSNSEEPRRLIQHNESRSEDGGAETSSSFAPEAAGDESIHAEEDQSYAKASLGLKVEEGQGTHKVLGIQWNVT